MKRLFLLITLLLTFTVGISHAQWAELPALPAVLNWPMTAELNGTFYVFGGVDAAASTTVYTYTSGDANWKTLSVPMPKGKFGGYAAAANGKIYIVGGMILSGGNFVVDNTTYEFDPTAVTFTPKAAIPSKVAFFAGAQVGGKIYAIGGATSTVSTVKDSNVIQIYDPSADTWTRSASKVPYTTRFAASAVLNGTIYVMGGNDANGYLDKAFRGTINGTTITWDERASVPSALTRPSAGVANGTLVFTGGVGQASPAGYSNTYTYDESSDTWTTSYGLPIPTYNAGQLFGSGNDLYFAGGYANKRAFKFTVSTAKLPEAIMTSDAAFINLSPNQSRSVTYAVQNLGVAALDVNISFPDSSKSWLNSEATKVTIDPLQSGSYTLTLSSGTLSPGLYKSTVTVTTNDPAHATTLISVKLYVLPASIQTQPTVAVLEEGTGDWCGYCPQGAEIADNIKQTYGDNFIALEYHGGSSNEPMMITAGQSLVNRLGIQGYPNAAIQRWFFPGEPYQMTNRGVWQNYVQTVFQQSPVAPVSLNVLSYSFDQASGKVHAVVLLERSLAMVNETGATVRLTTVVTEDAVDGQQEDYRTPPPYWIDYTWNDIVRQVYPNELGMKTSLPSTSMVDGNIVVPGDKVAVTVDLTVPTTILDATNCNITFIAHILKGSSTLGSILQAQQLPLIGSIVSAVEPGSAPSFSLEQNYPNPVAGRTTIGFSVSERTPVSITVHDVLGREVAHIFDGMKDAGSYTVKFDASKLSPGAYIYTMTAGGKTFEKTMTVTK